MGWRDPGLADPDRRSRRGLRRDGNDQTGSSALFSHIKLAHAEPVGIGIVTFLPGLPRLYSNILVTFGRQFAAGFLRVAVTLVVARILGPAGAGAYAIAMLLPTLMGQLLNLGMASSNVYFIASAQFEKEQVWATSRNVSLIMSIVGIIFGILLICFAGDKVFPGVPRSVLYLTIFTLPSILILGMIGSIFQAEEDFSSYNMVNLIEPVSSLIIVTVMAVIGNATLVSISAATVASYMVATAISLIFVSTKFSIFAVGKEKYSYFRKSIIYSIVSHASNITTFLNYRLDLFLVNLLAGPHAAGLYSVAVKLAEQVWIISQAVSTVVFPRLSAMVQDEAGRRSLTPAIARATLWVTLLASGVLAALGQPLIELMFGAEFRGAALMFLLLLPGIALFSCSRVLANDLAARGLVSVNFAMAIGALVLNTVGNVVLIPRYGAFGAAAVTSAVYGLDLVVRLALQRRFTSADWRTIVLPTRQDVQLMQGLVTSLLGSKNARP